MLSLAAVVLIAAESSWKERPIAEWNQEDAKQVLADSPWVKYVTPQPLADLSPNACRDGGDWNGCTGKGVGLAGTGLFGARREAEAIARAHAKPSQATVVVRWESALPIRAAEQKASETGVPTLDSDHYAIAVYDIPTPSFEARQEKRPEALACRGPAPVRRNGYHRLSVSKFRGDRQKRRKARIQGADRPAFCVPVFLPRGDAAPGKIRTSDAIGRTSLGGLDRRSYR
jgi:hypothetical protein